MSVAEIALETDMKEAAGNPGGAQENPFLDARRRWNSEVERAFSSARTWQVIGITGMLIGLGSVAGNLWLASRPRFVPYVIAVDSHGEAAALKAADRTEQANPAVIHAQLASFITSARQVSIDTTLDRQAIFRAFSMLRDKDPATVKMNEWWDMDQKRDPIARAANESVSVEGITVLQVSADAYQVDWNETARDKTNAMKELPYRMRAILTIYTAPLKDGATEAQIQANPLGIFVKDMTWTRTVTN